MKFNKPVIFIIMALAIFSIYANGSAEKGDETMVVKFAGSGGYPPFNYFSEENEVIGFDVDVAKEIAKRMGYELEYVTTAWDGIIEGLRAGRYNGILGSMAITDERLKVVDFSTPYYYSGAQLITRNDSGITDPSDITADNTIGLVTGTTFADDAEKLGAKVKLYEDDNQTLMELINGRVDAIITDRVVGVNALLKIKGGDQLILAGELLRTEKCAIALQKDDPMTEEINKILEEMREDGTLSKISEEWFSGLDITQP